MIKSLLLFMMLGQFSAGDSIEFTTPGQIISAAEQVVKDGETEKAIALYLTVSENDTAFVQVQAKLMPLYNSLKQYDKTIAIGEALKDEFSNYRKTIYINLGNAYLDQGNDDRGKEIYEEGLKLFPYSYVLMYNLGLVYYRIEDYETAVPYFQESSKINPFYASNHIMLGYIALLQGHRTKSMLSYLTYLAINPDRNSTLVFLENLASDANRQEGSICPFIDNSHFAYYDDLMRSKAALDPRFKRAVDFNATIVKQSELLFSKLQFVENSNDYWMDFYVPFYTQMSKENLIPDFIYFILQSTDNEDALKWLEKNDKEKSAWIAIANSALKQNRVFKPAEILGIKGQYNFWYFGSNALSAIGNQIDDDTRTGPWAFYSENGQMNGTGTYNDRGQKTGDWTYYHDNGQLSRTETYENDQVIKPAFYYHDNGALSIVANYKDGDLDGALEYYFRCGQIREKVPFQNGKKTGKGQHFFESGQQRVDYNMLEGILTDAYIHYYKNGQFSKKYLLDSGKTEGPYQSFYIDGQKNEIGQHADNESTGAWTGYHPNGKLRYEGFFTHDNRSGTWKFYYSNGKISEIITYDENGEKHGEYKNYNIDGILTDNTLYNKGLIQGYSYFDLQGNIIHEARDEGGNMEFKGYYPDGRLMAEGILKGGKLNGPYTTYYNNGNILRKTSMVEGNYHGEYEEYYLTGEISVECNYENGSMNGPYRQFYKNGTLQAEGWYVEDQQEQLWKHYHPDAALDQEAYYMAGKPHGWTNIYAPENKIQTAFKYDRDVLIGHRQYDTLGNIHYEQAKAIGLDARIDKSVSGDTIFKMDMHCGEVASDYYNYFKAGRIQSHQEVKNGQFDGNYLAFLEDGSPAVKGVYLNNKKHGTWHWYHSNGQVESEYYYINDLVEKDLKRFYYNGELESVCSYSNDQRNGACKYYNQSGELLLIKLYKEDEFISYVNIQNQDTISFENKGAFSIKSYYKSGKLAARQNYLNGVYHGDITFYNQSGKIIKSYNYHKGDMQGRSVKYFANGKVYMEVDYDNDLKHGLEKEYYENGKLRRETPYINDNRNGMEISYNPNGAINTKTYYWNDEIY